MHFRRVLSKGGGTESRNLRVAEIIEDSISRQLTTYRASRIRYSFLRVETN